MKVHLLGVRGSTPCPGAAFAGVGGHTSCVAVARAGRPVELVVDAGTGIRNLAGLLGGAPFRGSLLLGHLHWDHTQGLPFCAAMDHPDARTEVRLPVDPASGVAPADLLGRAMSPPHFPIGPEGLRGSWTFAALDEGWFETAEGFRVLALEIPHKGGRTLGLRIEADGVAMAYLSDHAPQVLGDGPSGVGELHPNARRLTEGVDLLLHDAQYTKAELGERGGWGHAAAEYGAELAGTAGARQLLLFHHDPARTDDEVAAVCAAVAASRPAVRVDVAREGAVIDLSRR